MRVGEVDVPLHAGLRIECRRVVVEAVLDADERGVVGRIEALRQRHGCPTAVAEVAPVDRARRAGDLVDDPLVRAAPAGRYPAINSALTKLRRSIGSGIALMPGGS